MSITYKDPNNTLLTGGVTPDNKLWFYGASWFDPSQENTLWFSSLANQKSWYASHRIVSMDTTDSIRYAIKDQYKVDFRVPYSTEELYQCAYVCRIRILAENVDLRYYYFIDSVDAYSPNSSTIHCTLDVMQTFMFDWKLGNQHILRCNGLVDSSLNDVRCFSNEDFMPVIEECTSSQFIDPTITDTVSGVSGKALSKRCYDVVVTEVWQVGGTYTKPPRAGLNDPSDLYHCIFTDIEFCRKFIDNYTTTNKNKIKGVYGIPFICIAGSTDVAESYLPIVDVIDGDPQTIGYVRQTTVHYTTYKLPVPTSWYSYTPYINKTNMVNVLSLETRSGKNAMFKATDLNFITENGVLKIVLSIVGILSISPKVLVFPHSYADESHMTQMKSSNYLSYDVSPSFSIFDSSQAEIYNNNYNLAYNKQNLAEIASAITMIGGVALAGAGGSAVGSLAGIAGGAMGIISAEMTKANMKETYQVPQNMIGTCESRDIWYIGKFYLVARWLSPTEQNLKAFDSYLATNGYNYSGRIEDLGNLGITMFSRKCFNYIQIDNCKLSGNVGIYKDDIQNIFNRGIRFWNVNDTQVNSDGIANYTSQILSRNQT